MGVMKKEREGKKEREREGEEWHGRKITLMKDAFNHVLAALLLGFDSLVAAAVLLPGGGLA